MNELLWTTIPYASIPIIVVAGLIGLWFRLRTRATKLTSNSELDALVAGGQPLVLQFFSNT